MYKKMLPEFFGILSVNHYIKNRIRLKVQVLKDNIELCEELQGKMINLNGIKNVKCNALVGSVLINYDEEIIDPITLIGIVLNLLGLEDEIFETKNGKITNFFKELYASIDHTIYNKTFGLLDTKSSIALCFFIFGIRKIRQNPILPNGVNLVWWGYNLLTKGGN